MEPILESLWGYWTSGFLTLVVITVVLGSIPWIATWLDSKLEKLALQEILNELKSQVRIN